MVDLRLFLDTFKTEKSFYKTYHFCVTLFDSEEAAFMENLTFRITLDLNMNEIYSWHNVYQTLSFVLKL